MKIKIMKKITLCASLALVAGGCALAQLNTNPPAANTNVVWWNRHATNQAPDPTNVLWWNRHAGIAPGPRYTLTTNYLTDYTHVYVSGAGTSAFNGVYSTNTSPSGGNLFTNAANALLYIGQDSRGVVTGGNFVYGINAWQLNTNFPSNGYQQSAYNTNFVSIPTLTLNSLTNAWTLSTGASNPPPTVRFGTNTIFTTNYNVP
jgi:hypothetical protein